MKLKQFFSALLTIAFLMAGSGYAQKVFQGKIEFDFQMTGEGLEGAEAFMPTGMSYLVGKKDMIMEMEGGMMAAMFGKFLITGKGDMYMLKEDEQVAYKIDVSDEDKEKVKPEANVTKEDETIEILGYECQKYRVETEANGETVTQYIWATDAFRLPSNANSSSPMGGNLKVEGIKGTALKVMSNAGGFTTILVARNIDLTKPGKNEFKIPKGYKTEKLDPSRFGGMF